MLQIDGIVPWPLRRPTVFLAALGKLSPAGPERWSNCSTQQQWGCIWRTVSGAGPPGARETWTCWTEPSKGLQKCPIPWCVPKTGNFHLYRLLLPGGSDNNSYRAQVLEHLPLSRTFPQLLKRGCRSNGSNLWLGGIQKTSPYKKI